MGKPCEGKEKSFYDSWTFIILVCLVLPIAFRSVAYAPFHIPSSSMKPTLLIGDFIFVSKYAYGYSRYSFPLGVPFFTGRTGDERPQRGDVVVFRPPSTPNIDFIKRVIGLPGDTIQMRGGELFINAKKVERMPMEDFVDEEEDGTVRRIKRYIETLPNGVSYATLDDEPTGRLDNTRMFKVPEGHYFMMGDNRDHSADSRTPGVSYVPEENLVGQAKIIFVSTSSKLWKFWEWGDSIRTERAFAPVTTVRR